MPGTEVSPHSTPSAASTKFSWRYGASGLAANADTQVGDWPIHCGAKPSSADFCITGAVLDGVDTRKTMSQPAPCS